jgi:hypothetical protein
MIHDRTGTGRPISSFTIPDMPDRISVRELIRIRVREEVARHNLQPAEPFHGLIMPTDADATRNGSRRDPKRIDWEAQAKVAVDAFERNGFFVLVDRRQAVSLDEEVDLTSASDVAFVKLVPLVGG